MLTDDEARRLLQQAAETVEVEPAAPAVAPPPRPIWPILVAAAAIVAIAVASVVLASRGGEPAPPASPPETGRVPSTFGYDLSSARALFAGLGLETTVERGHPCAGPDNRVVGTKPPAGTPYESGDTVVLSVTYTDPAMRCPAMLGPDWELLDFANGRGPAPAFASSVDLWVNGERTAILSADEASEPANWGEPSALTRLADASREHVVDERTGTWITPAMTTQPDNGGSFCTGPLPAGLRHRYSEVSRVSFPRHTILPCELVNVFRDDRGRIDAVVLRSSELPVPTKEPQATRYPGLDTAKAFRAFARGGDLPPMADQVDLYLGNAFTGYVTTQSATDREAWATCTELGSYAGRSCPLSPLDVLQDHPQVEYVEAPRGLCMPAYGPVPPDLRALDRVTIVPGKGSTDSCIQNFAVQLFVHGDDLVAVSLLLGEP